MKQHIQPMKTRSGGYRCITRKGMATSFAAVARVSRPRLSIFMGRMLVPWTKRLRLARGRGDAAIVPLKDTFATQVLAKPADTEL
jgi:hypothetical protein